MNAEERKARIAAEEDAVHEAIPPGGHRVVLAEVARRAGLWLPDGEPDETRTLRRLARWCAGQEAKVQRIEGDTWVWRPRPATRPEEGTSE